MGAGTWGFSLANLLLLNGHEVSLWNHSPNTLEFIRSKKRHPNLTSSSLHSLSRLKLTTNLEEALNDIDYLITVIPAQTYTFWANKIGQLYNKKYFKIINASKGIDSKSLKLIHQTFQIEIPDLNPRDYYVISGPSHAEEVINQSPTAIVVGYNQRAHKNLRNIEEVQATLSNSWFRVYNNSDLFGVELAGAVKNVISIACGISTGIGYGYNSRAALITRGCYEISKLGSKLGCNTDTFYGLAGIGDLVVTGMSSLSRNFTFGEFVGKGLSFEDIYQKIGMLVEGVETVKSTYLLASGLQVELPIVNGIYQILFNKKEAAEVVSELMCRDLKSEREK